MDGEQSIEKIDLFPSEEFVRQLFLVNGYAVDWSAVSVDELLSAMEASVYDTAPLIQVLRKCVSRQTE